MSQEDYDEGYEDGRKSRDAEVESLKLNLELARIDLARAKEDAAYYRALWHSTSSRDDSVPF